MRPAKRRPHASLGLLPSGEVRAECRLCHLVSAAPRANHWTASCSVEGLISTGTEEEVRMLATRHGRELGGAFIEIRFQTDRQLARVTFCCAACGKQKRPGWEEEDLAQTEGFRHLCIAHCPRTPS